MPAPEPQGRARAVFLVGFMGAGKSCVGKALALLLGWQFIDLDARIESRHACSIADIFRRRGEAEFRRLESEELARVMTELEAAAAVVALGGGAFVQPANFETLRRSSACSVFLDAPVEELWRRARAVDGARPLAFSENHFRQLYAARRPRYMEADYCVQTGSRKVEEVAAQIAVLLQGTGQGDSQ